MTHFENQNFTVISTKYHDSTVCKDSFVRLPYQILLILFILGCDLSNTIAKIIIQIKSDTSLRYDSIL